MKILCWAVVLKNHKEHLELEIIVTWPINGVYKVALVSQKFLNKHKKLKKVHQVAFEADEMDPHGDGALGVVAKGFNPVHQVCRELVTSLQHAQHHDVIVTKVVHDVACEALRPVSDTSKLTG